jgi:Tfp pilus assembly protein PilE
MDAAEQHQAIILAAARRASETAKHYHIAATHHETGEDQDTCDKASEHSGKGRDESQKS